MKKSKLYSVIMVTVLFVIILSNCKKKEDDPETTQQTVPVLTTTTISGITSVSATGGGNISGDGNATVTSRGVCWSTSQNPTTADNKTTDGTGTGAFTSSITGLTESTTYYARAYATNSVGTAYGNQVTFTTLAAGATTIPVLTTTTITGITSGSAAGGGNISSDGNATVTSRGVCWSTSQNPTTSDNKTTDGSGTGTFSSVITGLTETTTYYARAYATNSVGTAYGNQVSFTTLTSVPGTVTDYDGNVYQTVTIGTQIWMKENLRVTHYRDGSPITNVTADAAWGALTTEAYCWYNNDFTTNGQVYGALYNWYAVSDPRNICPVGWHVPSDAEWTTLTDYLGGLSVAGGKLKEAGTSHWASPNTGATNESNFTALPGGYRYSGGAFAVITFNENWWSSTQQNLYNAYQRYVSYTYASVSSSSTNLRVGNAVRLIKD